MVKRCAGWGLMLAGALAAAAALAAPQAVGQSQDLLLEAELEPAQVYVQAQAIYRLRFYQAVDVHELKINGPSARLADVRAIGNGRVYETVRDGRRYRVHERSYAVFAFSSGALELSGAHVLGRAPAVATTSADGRRPLRLEAPAQTLTVNPVPAAAGTAAWLPARSLSLSESWSAPATELRTGQVLQRSIRIEATGIDAAQIPPLNVAVPGMQVDAEAPRLENRIIGALNLGVREQTVRMVALQAGDIQVPELPLRWWNLNNDAAASATLPARSLHVVAADEAPAAIMPTAPASASVSAPVRAQSATATQLQSTRPWASKPWLALLAVAALLCAGLALTYARRPVVRAAWRLQRACRGGNAAAVRNALLHWAATIWPQAPPLTLEALARQWADPSARQALATIDRCLYGPHPSRCDGAALAAAVRAIKRSARQFPAATGVNQ